MSELKNSPCVYICIPVHNRIDYTLMCISSIKKQSYSNYKIIICDDGSKDNTQQEIQLLFPDVILLKGNGNLWWTGAINACVKKAMEIGNDEDYIYTLNNDTELFQDSILSSLEISNLNKDSIIGSLNLFYDNLNLIENSAFRKNKYFGFSRLNKFGEKNSGIEKLIEADALSGKGVLIPFKIFKKIGLYNFEKLPHYHADFEFTYRAKQVGYNIYLNYDSKLKSHQMLSGTGSVTSVPNIKEFLLSFNNIKSTHHLSSLFNYHKLIYKHFYFIQFTISLLFINLGFLKRFLKHKTIILFNNN